MTSGQVHSLKLSKFVSSSGTNDNKPNQVDHLVKSPVKIESLNDALDTEKAEIKREPDPKTDDKNEDIKTVQVNLISSSGQENSPPDLNQDSSESSDAVTSQQPEPDFNFEIKPKIEQQQGMFFIFFCGTPADVCSILR